MDLKVCNQTKNVDDSLALCHLTKNGSAESVICHKELTCTDNFSTNNFVTSDLESNSFCGSNFSENIDDSQITSIEKTRICVPLSIETKETNAFLLTNNKESKALKHQTELVAHCKSEDLENAKKKKIRNKRNEKNMGVEKESKYNKKYVSCCFLRTENVERNTSSVENKAPELENIRKSKSQSILDEPKQKTLEKNIGNISNNNGTNIIHQKIVIDKPPRLVEPNHNNVNCKSSNSKSLEDMYKIFEHRMNIEIPRFDNTMDLSFLSKRFGNSEICLKDPSPINFTNFNDKTISEIISETLSWYEIYNISKLKGLKCVIND